MAYRVSHAFVRLEALGVVGQTGRFNDFADPLTLEVYVTPSDDITKRLEEGKVQDADFSGKNGTPFRIATGVWGFDLTEELYQRGKQYTVNWRYTMTPGNVKVDRTNFVWNPVNHYARDNEHCVVYGTITDPSGRPLEDVRVTVEEYKDTVTLHQRIGTIDIATDGFGNWSIEVPRGHILRFVYGELTKVIQVPQQSRIAFRDAPTWQPSDATRKDKFGYPYP